MSIIGKKIKAVRHMTKAEAEAEGWDYLAPVIELDDGVLLYPSSDDEGNSAGALFGKDGDSYFGIPVERP